MIMGTLHCVWQLTVLWPEEKAFGNSAPTDVFTQPLLPVINELSLCVCVCVQVFKTSSAYFLGFKQRSFWHYYFSKLACWNKVLNKFCSFFCNKACCNIFYLWKTVFSCDDIFRVVIVVAHVFSIQRWWIACKKPQNQGLKKRKCLWYKDKIITFCLQFQCVQNVTPSTYFSAYTDKMWRSQSC